MYSVFFFIYLWEPHIFSRKKMRKPKEMLDDICRKASGG
jgi:hypothetical protein